jgi:hypothetical protein
MDLDLTVVKVREDGLGGKSEGGLADSSAVPCVLSTTGSLVGGSDVIANCILVGHSVKYECVTEARALGKFGAALVWSDFTDAVPVLSFPLEGGWTTSSWRPLRTPWQSLGVFSGPWDVNAVRFKHDHLPESLARRPLECSPLDVAVDSG